MELARTRSECRQAWRAYAMAGVGHRGSSSLHSPRVWQIVWTFTLRVVLHDVTRPRAPAHGPASLMPAPVERPSQKFPTPFSIPDGDLDKLPGTTLRRPLPARHWTVPISTCSRRRPSCLSTHAARSPQDLQCPICTCTYAGTLMKRTCRATYQKIRPLAFAGLRQ
jgi:hypothetical protein